MRRNAQLDSHARGNQQILTSSRRQENRSRIGSPWSTRARGRLTASRKLSSRIDPDRVVDGRHEVEGVNGVDLGKGGVRVGTRRGPGRRRPRPGHHGGVTVRPVVAPARSRRSSSWAHRSAATGRTPRPPPPGSRRASPARPDRRSGRGGRSKDRAAVIAEHREVVAVGVPRSVGTGGRLVVGAGRPGDLDEPHPGLGPGAGPAGQLCPNRVGPYSARTAPGSSSRRNARAARPTRSGRTPCRRRC